MSVWDDLVGQATVVEQLRGAAAGAADVVAGEPPRHSAMTHAWLFTGPPGSGRSVAARAFAAALQCPWQGCGTCADCHSVLAGTHPDVDTVVPAGLHLLIDEARSIVARGARSPTRGRWQVTVVEDADRMEERTSNTLLKAVEEPPERGVLLLCAPSVDDLLPTIRSRCRLVPLRLPSTADVAAVLTRRDGVDPAMAAFAARAAQGHVGRARWLARDEETRRRRRDVLALPRAVGTIGSSLQAAEALVAAAQEEAAEATGRLDAAEAEALRTALGAGGTGRGAPSVGRGTGAAVKDLERRQKSRGTRTQRDALDRALVDLAAFYRDVLAVQLGSDVEPVHGDLADSVAVIARATSPESTVARIQAVLDCRTAVEANVAPLLAVEAMALALRAGHALL